MNITNTKEDHVKMMKRKFVFAGFVAVLPLLAVDGHAAERWTCNVFTGPKHFINKALKPWGKQVREVTKGEVRVNFLPTSAAPPPKQADGIVAGTYDCAFIFHAFTAKRAVGPQFGILPFLHKGNAEQGSIAYWRTWNKNFGPKKEFADDGIKILSMFQFPGVHFWTAKDKPINSIADLKSQKTWALAGTSSRTMKAVGVNHVSGPAARVAEFTQTKVVQGIAGLTRAGVVNFAGVRFPKSGTFTTKTMMAPSFAWMVSKKRWNALSGDLRAAIMSVSGEKLARAVGVEGDKFEVVAAKKLAKAGVIEVKASKRFEANLAKAAQPQIGAWIKRAATIGVAGDEVLAEFDRIVGNLGS